MYANNVLISNQVAVLIFFILVVPPMLFINCSLLKVLVTRRRGYINEVATNIMNSYSSKKISNPLLAIACFVMLSIPVFVYVALKLHGSDDTSKFKNRGDIVGLWAKTIIAGNSTLNCIIFFWRNKTLRLEGLKIVKTLTKAWIHRQKSHKW